MITLLAFIGAISLLVLVHELGHYLVARRFGVKVLRFSLGFGSVLVSKRFGNSDTEWVVSAIPLGGYVKMVDEREDKVAPEDLEFAFNRKPVLQRMAIVVAGPLSNFLLAIVLYWALFVYGSPGLKPMLGDVPPGTPAALAQMQAGETVVAINGDAIPSWHELRWKLLDLTLRGESGEDARENEVAIEGVGASGTHLFHMLDISSLGPEDLDGEFLEKLGLHPYQPLIPAVIGSVVEGGVAYLAGLRKGDEITQANGVPMARWSDLVEVIRAHPQQPVRLEVRRGEKTLELSVLPRSVTESGKKIGMIGVGPELDRQALEKMFTEVRYGPLEALSRALRKTWDTSVISLKMLVKMVLGEISMRNLSGPITIADYAGQSAEIGLAAYFGFLALISTSLGVLNLLPIPLLDGGHLLYYSAELVKGSPVSEHAWEIGQKIGIVLLGMLMVFAIYNDIHRLVSG